MKIGVAFVANILFSTILIGDSFHQRRHVVASNQRKTFVDLTPDYVQEKRKNIPSTANLLSFGLPTLGIWLLTPILSLIDTSVVGMSSGSDVLSLAALGPGIAWIDATSYLCQFIGIATTNLYATALNEKNDIKAQQCLSHATISSLFLGVALGLLQYVLAPSIITVMAGVSTEIVPYGVKYARIRSLGALFGVPTIVGQAAFLAREDAVTPLQAVLVGAVVNLLGDVLLVSVLGMGLAGAAWATTLSQVAGALYLICAVAKRLNLKAREGQGEGHGLLAHLRRSIHIPSVTDLKKFLSFCGPLFFVLLAKSFLWSFTTFACSKSGAVGLAAHQITINFFLFFVIFGDATSQMAQTYLPGYFAHMHPDQGASGSAGGTNTPSGGENGAAAGAVRANAAKELVARISKIGLAVGAVNSAVSFVAGTRGSTVRHAAPCCCKS